MRGAQVCAEEVKVQRDACEPTRFHVLVHGPGEHELDQMNARKLSQNQKQKQSKVVALNADLPG
jgi:hypothetical protein